MGGIYKPVGAAKQSGVQQNFFKVGTGYLFISVQAAHV
ncbi:hypothetical protein NU09_2457 [Flavobacterium beibuense]|uniref:Uncharacterized protein n=1 Tax=Flavobacterium beibuense TaxID=657326 RepID=A0A444W8E0_9FLAO|nr:hypothetical protein NU09_2457 [Flavobacterium beibuense]